MMAQMNIAPQERARVKLQCLRLLATLALDRKKSHLISEFVEGLDTALELKFGPQARPLI